jgi:hypothetical protein
MKLKISIAIFIFGKVSFFVRFFMPMGFLLPTGFLSALVLKLLDWFRFYIINVKFKQVNSSF